MMLLLVVLVPHRVQWVKQKTWLVQGPLRQDSSKGDSISRTRGLSVSRIRTRGLPASRIRTRGLPVSHSSRTRGLPVSRTRDVGNGCLGK